MRNCLLYFWTNTKYKCVRQTKCDSTERYRRAGCNRKNFAVKIHPEINQCECTRGSCATRIIMIDRSGTEENCGGWCMNMETYGMHVVSMTPFMGTIIYLGPHEPWLPCPSFIPASSSSFFLSIFLLFFLFYPIMCLQSRLQKGIRCNKWNFVRLQPLSSFLSCREKKQTIPELPPRRGG